MARNGISATGQFFAPVMTIDPIILLQIAPPQ